MVDVAFALLALALIVAAARTAPGTEPQTVVRLTFPQTVTDQQAVAAFRSLAGLLPPWWRRIVNRPVAVLELHASATGITHLLRLPTGRAEYVIGALRAAVPGLRVSDSDVPAVPDFALARELRLSGSGRLRTDAEAATNASVLAALQPLSDSERIVIQYAITALGRGAAAAELVDMLRGVPADRSSGRPDEPQLGVAIRIGIAADPSRARQLAARVLGAFHPVGTDDARLARRLRLSPVVAAQIARAAAPDFGAPALRADELASLAGVPVAGPQLLGLTLGRSRELAPDASVPTAGLVLGDATVTERRRPVAVSLEEARRGLHICTPTGAGKSTVLANLVVQLMERGEGVVVIDSKGDLIADLADRIPASRRGDVVIFDPADSRRVVGFNLLGGEGDADLIVDHTVGQFRARYGALGLGPRSEDVLRAALLTLSREGGMTLCEVEPLLANSAFRQRLIGGLDEPVLESFWSWFGSLTEPARAEVIAPLANKLRSYTLRRRVRAVIGQRDGLDLAAALADRKVVLVSLAKGTVGEDASALLGAAIVSRLWTAIQARAAVPAVDRGSATVICDEFQDFARLPIGLGDAVAQSRGYGVGWILAHQHLSQLDAETRQGVLANCRSRLVMQTTAQDANAFAREFAPHLKAADLQGLGPYEGYAAVSTGASVAPPASIRTRPASPPLGSARAVRAASRKRYGKPASEIEQEIRSRVIGRQSAAPVGGKRRTP